MLVSLFAGSLRRRQPARSLLLKKTKKESRMEAELSGLRTRPRLEFPRRVRQAIRNLGKIASPGTSFFVSLKRGCLFPPSNSQLSSQSCAADRLFCSAWTFAASIRRICRQGAAAMAARVVYGPESFSGTTG